MNRYEIEKLRQIHALKGLRLDTASGLSGTIYDADGSATAPVLWPTRRLILGTLQN